jgi:hypothetical protein
MPYWASRTLAATLILVGAASCGGGGGSQESTERPDVRERGGDTTAPPNALETVRAALDASRQAGTARYAGSFFFDARPLGTEDPATGSALLRDGAAQYTVDMQDEPNGLVPEGTPIDEMRLEVRDTGDELFLQFPAAFEAAGIDTEWVRVPAAAPAEGASVPEGFDDVSLRVFLAARLLRPATCLQVLETATEARRVGPETVRDKATTRYALRWAPRKWVEDAGLFYFFGTDRSPERLATLDEVLERATIVDVWIDDLGRVRRVVASADLTLIAPYFDPPGDPEMWQELRTRCELYDYGAEVPSVRVPADVVTSAPAQSE